MCSDSYIGFTKHLLISRVNSHYRGPVYEHHIGCKNTVDFKDSFSLIKVARNSRLAHIIEAFYISKFRPPINKQMGVDHLPVSVRI